MKIQIKNYWSGSVIFETDAETIGGAVAAALRAKVNLSGADLRNANLSGANLSKDDLSRIYSQRTILPDGELTVYKKLRDGVVATLKIPAKAKRVGGLIGRKCRAEYAKVVKGSGESLHTSSFLYKPGKIVRPDKYDPNPLVECSNGIHFFITRAEAEAFDM